MPCPSVRVQLSTCGHELYQATVLLRNHVTGQTTLHFTESVDLQTYRRWHNLPSQTHTFIYLIHTHEVCKSLLITIGRHKDTELVAILNMQEVIVNVDCVYSGRA